MVAAFRGDCELTLMSTRKVVPWRVTFIRFCRISTDRERAASSGFAPSLGPLLRNSALIGSSRPGFGVNSSSSVSFSLRTTRSRIATDWISSVWLSIVASSVPKFDSTD